MIDWTRKWMIMLMAFSIALTTLFAAGESQKASAAVVSPNLINNPGFESGNLENWTVIGTPVSGQVLNKAADSHSGSHIFNYWYGTPYAYKLTQTITGFKCGLGQHRRRSAEHAGDIYGKRLCQRSEPESDD